MKIQLLLNKYYLQMKPYLQEIEYLTYTCRESL